MAKTIDERIEGLVESMELLQGMHGQTEKELHDLAVEVRRFRFWAEAVILHHESRLRALSKEPPEQDVQ